MQPRETIREIFVALIKAAKTAAGERVFNMRDFNFSIEIMPAINVSTQNETLEDGHAHGLRRRILTVDVECYATEKGGARCVDHLAWEVEEIFHANPTLNNRVESCGLKNIAMAFGDNGVFALHGAILTFEVIYIDDLRQSIIDILSTRIVMRSMRRGYGLCVSDYLIKIMLRAVVCG
ncbi:hypothetical protein V3565_02140 [Bartonella sp. B10]